MAQTEVQDNAREAAQIAAFGLRKIPGRAGDDAVLDIEGIAGLDMLPLELKTSTKQSVSTARDVTLATLETWRDRHWLITACNPVTHALERTWYVPPRVLARWIADLAAVIAQSRQTLLGAFIDDAAIERRLATALGDSDRALYATVRALGLTLKPTDADLPWGMFSREKLRDALRDALSAIGDRGTSKNNPKIEFAALIAAGAIEVPTGDRAALIAAVRQELSGTTSPFGALATQSTACTVTPRSPAFPTQLALF